ncbi:class I adenylate-forming enzyme family protein [Enterovirga aerilata]|uniref:AMP-binding protein n=1 Tax=Enterovirga aerilata TaxID=2730920 RepID=A0A849I3W0_9HYPH|nr:AMP-binding protein [Enterovirga sp. DB1703]NNM74112.1 AMP-binding protein [Enterovirga sp. DB1703]
MPGTAPEPMLAAGGTVGRLFAEEVRRGPERIALDDERGTVGYGQLHARAMRAASLLETYGVRRGDAVAILSENRREYVELLLGCAWIGAVLACPNTRGSSEELGHALRLSAASVAFVSERFEQAFRQARHEIGRTVVFGEPYEAALRSATDRVPPESAESEDILVILYTSGTTGFAKGAAISHRAMVARCLISIVDATVFPGSTFLGWAPFFHMAGADNVLATLMTGGKVVVMDGFDAGRLIDRLEREPVGLLSLMPATVQPLLDAYRGTPSRPKGVSLVGSMADLVPPALLAEITERVGAPYRNSFGSTETGPAPASRGRIPIGVAPESFAKTQSSFCALRLVDPEGADVEDGEPGEALVRSPTMFSGYWRMPELDSEIFAGGWYRMGDVLRRNPDGTLDFVDRRKYLIKSGGENIYPAEIERLLASSPDVAEAVVVRRPDARWGEVPVAFVVARRAGLQAADVISLCRGRVASFKVPKDVVFVAAEDIPRSATGKIKRHELEARLQAT